MTDVSWFSTREIGPRSWAIDDRGQDVLYLVCGDERCLLIDTGWGVGDLVGLVASLTSLPLVVVNTHGHPDHTFGNGQFPQVHVHAQDAAFVHDAPTEEVRRWIWAGLLPKPRSIAFGAWALAAAEVIVPIEEGHSFDLGGRKIEAIHVPGHSPGSIALLDRGTRWLFAGDSVHTGAIWLHLSESTPLRVFRASLQKLQELDAFDAIWPAHGGLAALPVSRRVLEDLCSGIDRILEGTLVGREERTFAGDGLRCDFGSCGIVYRADRLHTLVGGAARGLRAPGGGSLGAEGPMRDTEPRPGEKEEVVEKPFGWGILGPGNIARRFASDLQNLAGARVAAVGSRSAERASAFAAEFGADRAYGSYEELAADPGVDAIYVATPHPFHREHTLLCLEHGKAVLCEKPMGVSEEQVSDMVAAARAHDVFLMEAMWTRFLPVIARVRGWLEEGAIGDVRMLSADFGFRTSWRPESRLLNPDLAGGALLDVGVYTVAFAAMVLGGAPEKVHACAHIGETGVDEQTAMLLRYGDGALALLSCAVRTQTPQEARIQGSEGSIYIPAFWHARSAYLEVGDAELVEYTGSVGYHYEAAEVMSCVAAGAKESATMPLNESIAIARTLEQARSMVGVSYPFERAK